MPLGPVIIKLVSYRSTDLKITGPTGIFGETRDYKTVIRKPFADYLAHMLKQGTVPLSLPCYLDITLLFVTQQFLTCNFTT